MDRKCFYDNVTHRTRVITRWGDGVSVKRSKDEVEIPNPPQGYGAVSHTEPQTTPAILAHRAALKLMLQPILIAKAIDQGFFDRLKIDG